MRRLIESQLWAYGFVPLLIVLDRAESEEEYEVCNIILEVLAEHSKKYDFEIPTKFSQEAVALMKINFMTMFNLSGDITAKNNELYADEIIFKINEKLSNQ